MVFVVQRYTFALLFCFMYVYNVSVQVPKSLTLKWTSYMLKGHMDAVLATTCFQSAQLSKLHHAQQQDDEYTTFIVRTLSKAICTGTTGRSPIPFWRGLLGL